MENPQSLEEVLHELEWLIKSETDSKTSNVSEETYTQNEDLDFDSNV
jgi:thymidylate synthase